MRFALVLFLTACGAVDADTTEDTTASASAELKGQHQPPDPKVVALLNAIAAVPRDTWTRLDDLSQIADAPFVRVGPGSCTDGSTAAAAFEGRLYVRIDCFFGREHSGRRVQAFDLGETSL